MRQRPRLTTAYTRGARRGNLRTATCCAKAFGLGWALSPLPSARCGRGPADGFSPFPSGGTRSPDRAPGSPAGWVGVVSLGCAAHIFLLIGNGAGLNTRWPAQQARGQSGRWQCRECSRVVGRLDKRQAGCNAFECTWENTKQMRRPAGPSYQTCFMECHRSFMRIERSWRDAGRGVAGMRMRADHAGWRC